MDHQHHHYSSPQTSDHELEAGLSQSESHSLAGKVAKERYLDSNGDVQDLVVACSDRLSDEQSNPGWPRRKLRTTCPISKRLALWAARPFYETKSPRKFHRRRRSRATFWGWCLSLCRFIAVLLPLQVLKVVEFLSGGRHLVTLFFEIEDDSDDTGRYPPVSYSLDCAGQGQYPEKQRCSGRCGQGQSGQGGTHGSIGEKAAEALGIMDSRTLASLSLTCASDMLMERLLCTIPRRHLSPTARSGELDAFGAPLCAIEPTSRITSVCQHDAVTLSGARGTPISWAQFTPETSASNLGTVGFNLISNSAVVLFGAIALVTQNGDPQRIAGGIVMTIVCIMILLAPVTISRVFCAATVNPAIFGFEGHMPIEDIEKLIFGANFERLHWSTDGSLLSRRGNSPDGDSVGVDPTSADSSIVQTIKEGRATSAKHIFTLVDTFTMKVTLFEAERPPTSVFLCGIEGGRQRAVACSYDEQTQTMHSETVFRLPMETMDKMDIVPNFRIGIPE